MRPWAKRHGAGTAAATAVVALLAGCGGEKTFSAEEFVGEIGEQGVELELGGELFTDDEGKELYAVELAPAAKLPGQAEGHSGGSISVYDDSGGADQEMERCQSSADLLCYQASNVVVVLESGGGVETQQLGVAMKRLED